MKFINVKRWAVISLIAPLFMSGAASAFADQAPNPTKSAYHEQMTHHKMDMEKFDTDMGLFRESMTARMQIRQNINLTFKISVDKAISDSKVAIRDAAIAALGASPMKPIAPIKPTRPEHVATAPRIPHAIPSASPTA
jgi:hypothetical protein